MVAHLAYGAIKGGTAGYIGGIERQVSIMSDWLDKNGHEVIVLTWRDSGAKDIEYVNGVKIIKLCGLDDGLPGIRFFYPRWSSLIKALRSADADIYYQNCGEYVTGQVALWCRKNGRKFIYSVASDTDCYSDLPVMKSIRERLLYKIGLKYADEIIVQTKKQKKLMSENFSRESVVLPMPCPGPDTEVYREIYSNRNSHSIVWVGRYHVCKRLEILLDVADKLVDIKFLVAGKPNFDDEYSESLIERISHLDNVEMLGMVKREEMSKVYSESLLLCCTSEYEGFPNTFIEAWSYGLPIISTVDPDDILTNMKLGLYVSSASQIISAIQSLLDDREALDTLSNNARGYYEDEHTLDSAMNKFEHVFTAVLSQ